MKKLSTLSATFVAALFAVASVLVVMPQAFADHALTEIPEGVPDDFDESDIEIHIEDHEDFGIIVDLVPGADRGLLTLPLHTGTIADTGQTVYFIIIDASEQDFAREFGALRADSLAEAPDAAIEDAIFENGEWTFFNDAGNTAFIDAEGNVVAPQGNPEYSPLKRIFWEGEEVIVNVPFIKWGDEPGQQLIVDEGGCDPRIRSNPPSPFYVGGGPTDGEDCTGEAAVDRYKGGQVLDLDLDNLTVTFKLHFGVYSFADQLPYYIVTDASKIPPAGFMGVVHVPKMANLGRYGDNKAVGRIDQFGNGNRWIEGGPNRFQPGVVSYRGGSQATYSPMWHIHWVVFDCDQTGQFFDEERNVMFGAEPVAGSGIPGFDPADPATFDPFGMFDKGVTCPEVVEAVATQVDGPFVRRLSETKDLFDAGLIAITEAPGGAPLGSVDPMIVNCPVAVTVR